MQIKIQKIITKNIYSLNLTIMIFKVQGFKAHLRSFKSISNVYSKKDFNIFLATKEEF